VPVRGLVPEADGGTRAAEIQADAQPHGTPILFLTALVSQSETGKAPTLTGGHPFLAKPVDPDALLQCINRFARERS
jgi:CheY-like chemotaxis protein